MAGTTAKPGHSTIDNSTCAIVVRSVVNIQDSCQCRLCSDPASSRQGPATGTGRSDTCVDRWRGQVQNFDLNGRSDAGHILQPQKQTHYEMQINRDFTLSPENRNVPDGISAQTYKHEKESPDNLSSEDSFQARRLPTLPPGLAVPSAMTGLASLFGMGRGGSPSL